MNPAIIISLILVGLFWLALMLILAQNFNLWIQALISNARVSLLELIGIRLRKADVRLIVLSKIRAKKADIDLPIHLLESHVLAGGDLPRTV